MLIFWDFLGRRMVGQLLEHDVDVDQAVTASVYKHCRRLDVTRGELRYLVRSSTITDTERRLHFVIEHLKGSCIESANEIAGQAADRRHQLTIADDLKPVDNAFGRRIRVQMRICSKLLTLTDVVATPFEKKRQG